MLPLQVHVHDCVIHIHFWMIPFMFFTTLVALYTYYIVCIYHFSRLGVPWNWLRTHYSSLVCLRIISIQWLLLHTSIHLTYLSSIQCEYLCLCSCISTRMYTLTSVSLLFP